MLAKKNKAISAESFLLDTNIFVFLLTDAEKVPNKIKRMVFADQTKCFLSQVSLLEIGFKVGTGKLEFPLEQFEESLAALNLKYIGINLRHVMLMTGLKKIHKDPFDRLLVAQAIEEKLCLVTSDEILEEYEIETVII